MKSSIKLLLRGVGAVDTVAVLIFAKHLRGDTALPLIAAEGPIKAANSGSIISIEPKSTVKCLLRKS